MKTTYEAMRHLEESLEREGLRQAADSFQMHPIDFRQFTWEAVNDPTGCFEDPKTRSTFNWAGCKPGGVTIDRSLPRGVVTGERHSGDKFTAVWSNDPKAVLVLEHAPRLLTGEVFEWRGSDKHHVASVVPAGSHDGTMQITRRRVVWHEDTSLRGTFERMLSTRGIRLEA